MRTLVFHFSSLRFLIVLICTSRRSATTAGAFSLDVPSPPAHHHSAPFPATRAPDIGSPPNRLMEGVVSFLMLVDDDADDEVDASSYSTTSSTTSTAKITDDSSSLSSAWKDDRVLRVLDANTIKLEKAGLVSLAAVKTPQPGSSTFQFPECFNRSPSYKIKQLLTAKNNNNNNYHEKVRVQIVANVDGGNKISTPPQAVVVRSRDGMVVNEELVRSGFAQVRRKNRAPNLLSTADLQDMERRAREHGLGLYQRCSINSADDVGGIVVDVQFEPLELTTETRWGVDGGKTVLRARDDPTVAAAAGPPPNPGDRVGCSDFAYYEDALKYYEKFFSYYGDVAKLDRNADGVPCPGLPHTPVADRYRMKIPKATKELE